LGRLFERVLIKKKREKRKKKKKKKKKKGKKRKTRREREKLRAKATERCSKIGRKTPVAQSGANLQ
jgi:hypothetical protein